jgi:4-alpha-glucanotransferase
MVVRPGSFVGRGELVLEDGTSLPVDGELPADIPLGYHTFEGSRLIVVPERCHLPDGLCTWGWAVQLYAVRSASSTGMGDLADLRRLAQWSRGQGAGVVLVNPLCAGQRPSPYYPSTRCFLDPIYLRVEEMPVAPGPLIDRDEVWRRKLPALEAAFAGFGGDPLFDRFCAERGPLLDEFAVWCDPARPELHKWLQWQLDVQLAVAAAELPIMADLPVGSDPDGFDVWRWRDVFELDATVGAPPDDFNRQGQDWGFPPFDPERLRAAGYEPFVQVVRAAFRHAGAVRIDHVMGLFRLYWMPRRSYVQYPWEDLLGIVALESVRAGAFVVGEDLGTVEPRVREALMARGVLSYRLLWFEDAPPSEWPRQSLAAVTTHDLPTIAGVWSGHDPDAARLRSRLADGESLEEGVDRTYARLAEAPSMVVVATLEDVLGVEERPNRPGTVGPRNWSVPLPLPLEAIEVDARPAAVARRFAGRRPRIL